MPYTLEAIKKAAIKKQRTGYAVLRNTEGWTVPLPFDPSDRNDKYRLLSILRGVAKVGGAAEAWLVTEAWVALADRADPMQTPEAIRATLPDDLGTVPGRLDALICQHETAAGLQCWLFEIKRAEDGRVCALVELEGLDPRRMESNTWLLRDPNAGHTRQ